LNLKKLTHEHVCYAFLVNLKIVNVHLFRQSTTFQKPGSLVLWVLFQKLIAELDATVVFLALEAGSCKEKVVHL
jgi:hypothetical protein